MSAPVPADQSKRDRLRTELDRSFVVEAAAGTGKTTVLIHRVMGIVRTGRARLEQLVAVTFTERAAGEMKLRLRGELEKARLEAVPGEEARIAAAIEALEIARVGTIHGLCADLLREYPVEAGVDPHFEMLGEDGARALRETAFHRWFDRTLGAPPEGVRRILRRGSDGPNWSSRDQLLSAMDSLIEHRDFSGTWIRRPFPRDERLDAVIPHLRRFAGLLETLNPRPKTWWVDLLVAVERFVGEIDHREAVSPRDHDGLEAGLRRLFRRREWLDSKERIQDDGHLAIHEAVYRVLGEFVSDSDADLAACLHAELQGGVAAYEEEKAARGCLDYVDLLLLTRKMLGTHAGLRSTLQQRFTHLFVDEMQDTDPLQAEILLLLAGEDPSVSEPFAVQPKPGKLFVVADPKQSIYRWRRADVQFYQRLKKHLQERGAEAIDLSTSFRSTPGIQAAINGAFEPVMQGGHQPQYVALDTYRGSMPNQPSLVALSVANPFGERGSITKSAVEKSVPETVAAFIDFLVRRSGWKVTETVNGVDTAVPIEARHVCILFRRLTYFDADLSRGYASALERHQLDHVLVNGRSFHSREEVQALRTVLWAIERPEDEVAVYGALKGPFVGLSDAQLFVFKHRHKRLHPLKPYETTHEQDGPVLEALGLLKRLHYQRNQRPSADTLHDFLESTRAHAAIAFWQAGEQRLANVLQLAELCRRYEKQATSFRDVLEWLQGEADRGRAPEAPIVEEGTQGVRMMTVHSAKGLEFPVVILAEPTANAARREPSHWLDPENKIWAEPLAGSTPFELHQHSDEVKQRDWEETLRVTYVAATRAREVLVVPTVSGREFDETWTEVLYPSLYPKRGTEASPRPAPSVPVGTGDTVLQRFGGRGEMEPRPGLHVARTGKNGVVWWDPSTLTMDPNPPIGLQRSDALAEGELQVAEENEARWREWQAQREEINAAGVVPTVKVASAVMWTQKALAEVAVTQQVTVVETPTAVAVAEKTEVTVQPEPVPDVPIERTAASGTPRPHGRRFGALVHQVLARVGLTASTADISALSALVALEVMATDEERAAAVVAVEAALKHPRFQAAARSVDLRREVALVEVLSDATQIEGVADLAYLDGDAWVVIELKTDEELAKHRDAYLRQVELYARAIAAATGQAARPVLLQV